MGAEEELDLEKITNQPSITNIPKTTDSRLLPSAPMGRLDLTAEMNLKNERWRDNKSELKNLHGLRLFFKVKASRVTSVFVEAVNQDFFYVSYEGLSGHVVNFGKIIVPFGDTRYFHHYYGGVQGFGGQGILLPNVWSESGLNIEHHLGDNLTLDTYVVNGFRFDPTSYNPSQVSGVLDLTNGAGSSTGRQALGLRGQWHGFSGVSVLGSLYYDHYWESKAFYLTGLDVYTEYGLWSLPIRMGAGIANATATAIPDFGTLHRRGDYLMVAGMGLGPGEWRVRYGTYNHFVNEPSANDKHSFEMGYSWNIDVIRLLIQRQWNFESKTEIRNDLWRLMASLDF